MAGQVVAILNKMTKSSLAEQNLEGSKETMWVSERKAS